MSNSERSFKQDAILLIVGIVLGGVVTYGFTWCSLQEQRGLEQHNVAQALYIDISDISDRFNNTILQYNKGMAEKGKEEKLEPYIIIDPRPYYSDDGLYFTYSTEIYKLNSNISRDLYSYYRTVNDIEYKRQYIYDHEIRELNGEILSPIEKEYINQYSEILPNEINISVNDSIYLKKQLKEIYKLNIDIPPHYTIYHEPKIY
jgi:hypothetical protein